MTPASRLHHAVSSNTYSQAALPGQTCQVFLPHHGVCLITASGKACQYCHCNSPHTSVGPSSSSVRCRASAQSVYPAGLRRSHSPGWHACKPLRQDTCTTHINQQQVKSRKNAAAPSATHGGVEAVLPLLHTPHCTYSHPALSQLHMQYRLMLPW